MLQQLALPLLLSVSAPADTKGPLPFEMQVERLDNGLTLIMVPRETPGLIAYYTLVRVGSGDETEKGVTGFAHFFEHMMFRGTEKHPPEAVSAFLKKTGADQNGFTTDDFTCYTFFGSSAHLEELIEIESDRFQNLKYTEDVFKTESKAVLGEYNKSLSSPSLPLEEKLREKVFTKHTYGHTTLGYIEDIKAMPTQFEYSKSFFDRFYTPDNSAVIAVGDFDPKQFVELAKKHYSGWSKKRAKTNAKTEPRQRKDVKEHIDWKTPTLPMLSMSWKTPKTNYSSKDTAVYNLVFELLFGKISKMYTELVLEQQKVVSFDDWSWNHKDPYLFHTVAKLKSAEDLPEVEKRVEAAITELKKRGPDKALLEDVKKHVRYALLLELATPDAIAVHIAYYMGPTGEPDGLAKLVSTIEKVTPKDVQRFARKYLNPNQRSIVTLVHAEEASK